MSEKPPHKICTMNYLNIEQNKMWPDFELSKQFKNRESIALLVFRVTGTWYEKER